MTNKANKILVVDDQEDNRIILSRRLARQGYDVGTAVDGVDALKQVAALQPDLILLDYMMPKLSGMDVLKELREVFDRSALPIIMVTAKAEDQDIVSCISAGANDFIPKPISFPVLTARIEAQMERRAAAIALQKINEDLEQLVATRTQDLVTHNNALRDAHDALARADRAKSLFLATMSHEMRTPLNSIIGLSEIMRSEVQGPMTPPAYRSYVDEIRRSGGYLLELVTDIMDSIAFNEQTLSLQLEEIDVIETIVEAISMLENAAPDSPTRIRFGGRELGYSIRGDKSRLRRVFSNIIGNALKFSPPDKNVVVDLVPLSETIVIEVLDRGPGIPPEKLGDVFTPFIQVYNMDSVKQKGIGLGLSIAQEIMRLHNGEIEIENREDGGLCVRLTLPAAETGADTQNPNLQTG